MIWYHSNMDTKHGLGHRPTLWTCQPRLCGIIKVLGNGEKNPALSQKRKYWIRTLSTVEPLGINKRTEFVMFPWILKDVCFGTFRTFNLFNSTKSQKALNSCIFLMFFFFNIYHIWEMLVFTLFVIFVISTYTWTLTIAAPNDSSEVDFIVRWRDSPRTVRQEESYVSFIRSCFRYDVV